MLTSVHSEPSTSFASIPEGLGVLPPKGFGVSTPKPFYMIYCVRLDNWEFFGR